MNYVTFAAYIRYKTHTDSTSFDDTDLLLLANVFKDEIAQEIAKANEDYFGITSLASLVADQREYGLPEDLLNNIKMVEAKLDGTNWQRLTETDLNLEVTTTDEAGIMARWAARDPQFLLFNQSIYLMTGSAITAVTDGLKLKSIVYPPNFTDLTLTTEMAIAPSTTSHGWPRPFQELLARRVIIEYKQNKDNPIPLTVKEQQYDVDLQNAIASITGTNLDRELVATTPEDDGSNY